jgi:hypothetical protein
MSDNTNQTMLVSQCTALVEGLQALSDSDTMLLGGSSYAKSAVLAPLLAYLAAVKAAAAEKVQLRTTVAAQREAKAAARAMRKLVKPYLQGRLGTDNAELVKYGYTPAKPRHTPIAVKADAAKKAKDTRVARGTMGKRQRKTAKATPPAAPAKQ